MNHARWSSEAGRAELEQWRQAKADYVAKTGRKIHGPPKPRPVPQMPTRPINLTDSDSRPVKTAGGFLQGYNAQAVATKEQFVIAAEVRIGGNERSDLGPLIDQACEQLDQAGVDEQPGLVLADAGYWTGPHINALAARGIPALVAPDADTRKQPSRLRRGGALLTSCAPSWPATTAARSTPNAKRSSSPACSHQDHQARRPLLANTTRPRLTGRRGPRHRPQQPTSPAAGNPADLCATPSMEWGRSGLRASSEAA